MNKLKLILASFWVSLLFTNGIFAKILLCDVNVKDKVCKNVTKSADYRADISPLPQPTIVSSTINILDVLKLDKEKQTLALKLKLRLFWNDPQLHVHKSNEQGSK